MRRCPPWKGDSAEEQLCRVRRSGRPQGYLNTTSVEVAWGRWVARVGAVVAGQQPASSDTSREETRIKDWADVVSCCAAGWVGEGQAEAGGAGIAPPPPGKGSLGTRPCKLTTSASPVGTRLLLGTPRAAAPRPRCSPSPAMARGPLLWGQKTPQPSSRVVSGHPGDESSKLMQTRSLSARAPWTACRGGEGWEEFGAAL